MFLVSTLYSFFHSFLSAMKWMTAISILGMSVAGIIITLLSVFFFYKIIIEPFFKLRYYGAQGSRTFFFPITGEALFHGANVILKGDLFHKQKQLARVSPNLIANATNCGSDVVVEVIDVALVKDFLNNQDHYKKCEKKLGFLPMVMESSVVMTSQETWERQRTMTTQALHTVFTENYFPKMQEIVQKHMKNIASNPDRLKNRVLINDIEAMGAEMWGKMFFGDDYMKYVVNGKTMGREYDDILHSSVALLFGPLNSIFGVNLYKWSIWPTHILLRKRIRDLKRVILHALQEQKQQFAKEKPSESNVLYEMLKFQEEDKKNPITDMEIVDQFINLWGDGFVKTGHALLMMVYNLAMHPEVKSNIDFEISKYYDTIPINSDSLKEMRYLEAFMNESMRFFHPLPEFLFREALVDHTLGGNFVIRKGTIVTYNSIYASFNPKFHDDAETFLPDRWLNPMSKENKADSYAFVPFSEGPRKCIGFNIAPAEMKIMLCEFIKNFDLKVINGYKLVLSWRAFYEPLYSLKFDLTPKIEEEKQQPINLGEATDVGKSTELEDQGVQRRTVS